MKNLLQKIVLPGMMGLAGLVSGCYDSVEKVTLKDTQPSCNIEGQETYVVTEREVRKTYFAGNILIGSDVTVTELEYWCEPYFVGGSTMFGPVSLKEVRQLNAL